MNNGIIITIDLPGKIGSSVSHTEKQTVRLDVAKIGSKKPVWINKQILHSDRPYQKCYKKINISSDVIQEWVSDTVPFWSTKKEWSGLSENQRLASYIVRFDEGYGVSFEFI